MPILRELLTILGFKAEDKELKAYDAKIVSLKKNLFLLSAAAAAVAVAIFGIAESAAKVGDELDKTKDLTGLTVEQLQELGGAAKLAGIDVQGLTTGMQLFSRQISQAGQGQQMSIRAFEMLGVSIFSTNGKLKSNHQLLLEVADAFSRLQNQQVKTDIALQLFGRSGGRMINLLKKGAAGVREAEAEFKKFGFTLTDVQSKAAAQFQDRLTMVGFAVKGLKNAIGTALLPEVSRMVNMFLEWFSANKKVIQQNMIALFKNLGTFVKIVSDIFGAMLKTLTKLVNTVGGWNKVLKIASGLLAIIVSTKIIRGIAALGTSVLGLVKIFKKLAIMETLAEGLALIWPAIAIIVALAIDDIANAIKGNDSIIGRLMKRYKTFGSIVRNLVNDLRALKRGLSLGEQPLKNLGKTIEKIPKSFATFAQAAMIPLGGGSLAALRQTVAQPALIPATVPTAQKSVTNHVNTNVNLSVPEGTPEQQKGFLRQTAEKTFNEVIDRHLKEAQARFPVME